MAESRSGHLLHLDCRYGPSSEEYFAEAPQEIVELGHTDVTGATRRLSIAVSMATRR